MFVVLEDTTMNIAMLPLSGVFCNSRDKETRANSLLLQEYDDSDGYEESDASDIPPPGPQHSSSALSDFYDAR